jgi:hypothetical protein
MLFNDIDKSKPYTVLMVSEPTRLACLSFAGLARGVYYIQGDFRSKISKPHDKRLVQAGLIALRFVSDAEKPEDFAKTEEIRVAVAHGAEILVPASSGVSASPPVEMVPIFSEPSTTSPVQTPHTKPVTVVYDQVTVKDYAPAAPTVFTQTAYQPGKPGTIKSEVVELPPPVTPFIATESAPAPTVQEAITSETPAVPTEAPFVVATEAAPVCTEVTVPEDTLNPQEDDEPVVILDDQPKKRRGRKPKAVNVVAPAEAEAKLTEHEQDSGSADQVPAPLAEDSVPNENSQALA